MACPLTRAYSTDQNDAEEAAVSEESPYYDEWGHHLGYCNSCGEEAELGQECCDDGEVVPYDDDPDGDEF